MRQIFILSIIQSLRMVQFAGELDRLSYLTKNKFDI